MMTRAALTMTFATAFSYVGASIAEAQFVDPIGVAAVAAYEGSQVVIDPGAVDGNELQTWVDQSAGGNNDANNVSGALDRRPTLLTGGLNGHNTVAFRRGDQEALFFDNSPDLNTSEYSYFAVAKFTNLDGTPNIMRVDDATSNFNWGAFAFNGDSTSFHGRGSAFVGANVEGSTVLDQWYIFTGVLDGTAADPANHTAFGQLETLDGSSSANATATDAGGLTFGTHERTTIGARPDFAGGDWLDGEIAELIVYNVALEEPDQIAVQSYLRAKYVPEPATATLLLLSSLALATLRRRSMSQA